jgi:hypothetical protein
MSDSIPSIKNSCVPPLSLLLSIDVVFITFS